MAGLEVVVRPFVFPDIRPRARQSLPPQDDPAKGFAKIDGQSAKQVSLSHSSSISSSHSKPVESERRFDEARVYQQEDDGTINKDNFIDVEVVNRIKTKEPAPMPEAKSGLPDGFNYKPGAAPAPAPKRESKILVDKTTYYSPMEPGETVIIRNKNKTRIYVPP